MEDFRREFLNVTISNLTILRDNLQNRSNPILSEDFLRNLFRQIHTVKGTAQTFQFIGLARLAHEIENLLQILSDNEIVQNEEFILLIGEGLAHLLKLCGNQQHIVPIDFSERINRLIPNPNKEKTPENIVGKIPPEILSEISAPEKSALNAALERGQRFYLIETFFDLANFDKEFERLRRILDENGTVIAVSAGKNANVTQEIGFQIFFVSLLSPAEINSLINFFNAEIIFENESPPIEFSNDVEGVIRNLIADCGKKAKILGKKISFEVLIKADKVSPGKLILINNAALHLLRNAIDHAIEPPAERIAAGKKSEGKISVSVFSDKNALVLKIQDDGRGISIEKVTTQAKQRGIIKADRILSERETLDLIFMPGFSTGETISEISGRGIGLDAVKDIIERAGGTIEVQTRPGHGSSFEMHLPVK